MKAVLSTNGPSIDGREMKNQPALSWLIPLIIVLALIAAGIGLFYQDAGTSFSFTAVRGDTVQIYGQGLYRLDTPMVGVGFRAADFVTIVLAIPLLILSIRYYKRGSIKGGLMLSGVLAYFLYNYISVGFSAVYNDLFIIYIGLFSMSLFAFVFTLTSFDLKILSSHFSDRLPRRGISIYLIVSGIILALVWLMLSIIPALLQGDAPLEARYYTTFITGIVDDGIIAPALIFAGVSLLRRKPIGYLLSPVLLVFTVVLGANLTAGGTAQILAGVISIGQAMAFTVPFVILTLFAVWFTIALFHNLSETVIPLPDLRSVNLLS